MVCTGEVPERQRSTCSSKGSRARVRRHRKACSLAWHRPNLDAIQRRGLLGAIGVRDLQHRRECRPFRCWRLSRGRSIDGPDSTNTSLRFGLAPIDARSRSNQTIVVRVDTKVLPHIEQSVIVAIEAHLETHVDVVAADIFAGPLQSCGQLISPPHLPPLTFGATVKSSELPGPILMSA